MTPPGQALNPRAVRLQQAVILSLALQLAASDPRHPLFWGVVILVLLTALKLWEARRPVDLQRSALAELLCVGVLAVIHPGLGWSLVQALTALLAIAAIVAQEMGEVPGTRGMLEQTARLVGAALPLMLVLFLLLPRLGPLWQLPLNATGTTGLSADLDPGGISSLVRDPSSALRISFGSRPPPPPGQRYWRVLVLDRFDGRRWQGSDPLGLRRERWAPPAQTEPAGSAGTGAEQLWLVEPSPLPQLPWGGQGRPAEADLRINPLGMLFGVRPSGERRIYTLLGTDQADAWSQRPPGPGDLDLPGGTNPRLEELGRSWSNLEPAPQRVEAARRWFRQLPFRYTLQPGALPAVAPLDSFLFGTRAGFCEHFAASFTALMRSAGVPARVVVGYQGGDWVSTGGDGEGYLDVRQSDAHAWSEVWLEPQGWVRVDPTGWVDPARIEQGLAGSLSNRPGELALLRLGPSWLRNLGQRWGALDLLWTRWMLGFDGPAQQAWLGQMLGPWRAWQGVLLLAGLAVAMVTVLALLQLQQSWRNRPEDRWRRQLDRRLRPLRRLGLEPLAGESLGAFCARAARRHPPLAAELARLERDYTRLRFERPAGRGPGGRPWRSPGFALALLVRRFRVSWLTMQHKQQDR